MQDRRPLLVRLRKFARRKSGELVAEVRRRFALYPEATATDYNSMFAVDAKYQGAYEQSPYLDLWEEIAGRLDVDTSVLEVGCGPGQFAALLHDRGIKGYTGFDLSSTAIESARRAVPSFRFEVDDAFTSPLFATVPSDVCVLLEVLEHVKRDREVLRLIPSGTRVIATVPNHISAAHVRWFKSEQEVERRYRRLLTTVSVTSRVRKTKPGKPDRVYFLLEGVRR